VPSVQDYIDERPLWADGTLVCAAPMTAMQWRIWSLAAAGKFFEGFIVFMTGVALPLISHEFGIGAAQYGLVSAAPLLGILIGAIALGGLSDRFGRKRMFIVEMFIFVAFLALVTVSTNVVMLVCCLFGLRLALGCDYPTAHLVISENIASTSRGRLVLGAFAFQAVGALVGTGVGFFVLRHDPTIEAWRWMFAAALIPAVAVTIGRFYIIESANWLWSRGDLRPAERAVAKLLLRTPQYPARIDLEEPHERHLDLHRGSRFASLFTDPHSRRATILASVPWFLQDLATYGIGIFTPTILAVAFGAPVEHVRSTADIVTDDILAAKGSAAISSLLIGGIFVAVLLADRVGRIKLQIAGFIGCAAGLFLAALSTSFTGRPQIGLIFAGFMLFDFMTNLGPNAQTYLLAGEVFPTPIRGIGAGFAAAFAKLGAVTTALLFPVLLAGIGTRALLGLLIAARPCWERW
jgi:MFS transporter, putative metabolite transport protein